MARNQIEVFAEEIYQAALGDHPELWKGATLEDTDYIFNHIVIFYDEKIHRKIKTTRQRDTFCANLFEHIAAGLS